MYGQEWERKKVNKNLIFLVAEWFLHKILDLTFQIRLA